MRCLRSSYTLTRLPACLLRRRSMIVDAQRAAEVDAQRAAEAAEMAEKKAKVARWSRQWKN